MGLSWWLRPYDPKRDAREKEQKRRERERQDAREEREYNAWDKQDKARRKREHQEYQREIERERKRLDAERRKLEKQARTPQRPPRTSTTRSTPQPARTSTTRTPRRVTVKARAARPAPVPVATSRTLPLTPKNPTIKRPSGPVVVPLVVAEAAARDLTRQKGTFTAAELKAELVNSYAMSSSTDPAPVLARLQAARKVVRKGSGYASV